jgi:acetylornithine/succinyldiaminopimelate/putrescine aminotransferase
MYYVLAQNNLERLFLQEMNMWHDMYNDGSSRYVPGDEQIITDSIGRLYLQCTCGATCKMAVGPCTTVCPGKNKLWRIL